MNTRVEPVVKYLSKREEGRKLLSIVRDSYKWYSQGSVEHSGISNLLSSNLFTDEHRIVRIEKDDNLGLLGAYILGFGVRERFISKELLENLEFNLHYLSPLMLAKVLEIKPDTFLDYEGSKDGPGKKPRLVQKVSLPEGGIDYLIKVEDMAQLTVPPVDMHNLDSLSEEEVVCRYKLSGNPVYMEVMHRAYQRMIYFILNKEFPIAQDMAGEEELFSIGVLGLLKAMNSYDLSKNVKFNTYAYKRISGTIADELRKNAVSTRGVREAARILGEKENIEQESVESLAEETGFTPKMIERALAAMPHIGYEVVSLNKPLEYLDEKVTLAETIPSDEFDAPGVESREEDIKDVVNRALALLPTEERDMIFAHYFQGVTLMKLGEMYGISESRVSQLITGIQERLRKTIDPSQIGF